ncbi:Serine/threonine-protein kinase PknD [Paraburkholderia hiiakae]|uniref:Serine/threonine-protein kinase PknD n=1 Tax=Paraburkholderia hiiakae TaxID=1081782 RepID=A0ABN7HT25_9BURK|nr:AAA family ATPase [Paraburkholderia hiiakae]CAD6534218.1 Serine/threonine-protein kinase PknD [Paraburkholderia hiiakae]
MRLTDYDRTTLSDDGQFVLSRLRSHGESQSWLTVTLSAYRPLPESQERLERAYQMRAALAGARVTLPHALQQEHGNATLVLEDPGGMPLRNALKGPFPLERLLPIATSLAAALCTLHCRGLTHNDIRPGNILLAGETHEVALTGLGLVSSEPRERPVRNLPMLAEEALAYLSPERTGLMNRWADSRADLYSLGVVLYEMLTGQLPYRASSPAEWLHCHTAQMPIPIAECMGAAVPEPLSSMIARLLAKDVAQRYQTAEGVEHDLRCCLEAWRQSGRIDSFALGTADSPDQLQYPYRLYGREKQVEMLEAALSRVVRHKDVVLALVSGYSGIGKSTLVNGLRETSSATSRGWFASGKFDRYKRDIPYTTLAQAFQDLIRQVIDGSPAAREGLRARLVDALGANGVLITDLIPELEQIIGPQAPAPELPPQDARTRFLAVFTRFIGAFPHEGRPLVLFLDDLQWSDAGTLAVLERLCQSNVPNVLLVGAYRDNEVGITHPLRQTIDSIRQTGTHIDEIMLAPLQFDDVAHLIGDALKTTREELHDLSRLVFERTGGNPFYVVQFLKFLTDEHHLAFDREHRVWRWDSERMREASFAQSIVDLMVEKIERLPGPTQALLRQFACLGGRASSPLLARISGMTEPAVDATLADGVEAGLLYRSRDGFAFVHDRVHEATYDLIHEDERARAHLRIGRILAAQAPTEEERDIFEIVNQYNRVITLIDVPQERERVVDFNLEAGRRARASSAYASALTYLSVGSELLGEDEWDHHYARKFLLETQRAECEFLTGDTQSSKARLSMLERRARTLCDRAAITFLRITLYTALDQVNLAVETCLTYLRHVGIDWTAHPERSAAREEYDRLLDGIANAPIEALVDLPLLGDAELTATMNVLTAVLPPAFFSDENLVCLVLCRMANLSLAHGNSDASSLGYAYLGMVAGPLFDDYDGGYRFGQLGLALVDKRGLDRFKARVYMCFAYHVTPWTKPIRTGIPLLRLAFEAASEAGDLTYIGFSSCCTVTTLLAAGESLGEVEQEATRRLQIVQAAKFGLIVDIITAQLALIRSLRAGTTDLAEGPGPFADDAFEQRLESDPSLAIAACWYWIRKQQARYLADDVRSAMDAGNKATPLLWTSSGHFEMAEYQFFSALTRARWHAEAQDDERTSNLDKLAAHHHQLELWATHCPSNFGSRAALVRGEIARLAGRDFDAMTDYEEAIRLAREYGFVQIEALAQDIAAMFYLQRGFTTIAGVYLRNARLAWLRWGAIGRVKDLDRRYPDLLREQAAYGPTQSALVGQIDVDTVMKASQAISAELVPGRLIHTLMTIMLEHAGARRALLVLPREEKLRIEAVAVATRQGTDVSIESKPVSPHDLAEAVLHESIRTRRPVLLDDASANEAFHDDEYFIANHSRSVLSLPLVKQSKLIGVLYLENELAPGIFTPARLAVLRLLASQAAISLENASLEEKQTLLVEKEALLHEVHHRVKNNLQLISSLLNLQAERVEDKAVAELFADSRNRVRSMAMVHENLYRAGNFARIPMTVHVKTLCGHLARVYDMGRLGVDMQIAVDDIQLDMNRAVSCGLIINELVSNALKHAFPNQRGGVLRIDLRALDTQRCELRVSDDGVGLAPDFSLERDETLGLRLVHDLVLQLRGSVDVSQQEGTTFTIFFDAAEH